MPFQPNQPISTCTTVNLRTAPGYLGEPPPAVLTLLPAGTPCTVSGAATLADGLTWWPVRVMVAGDQALAGWLAEQVGDQRLLTAAPPTPPPPPEPVKPVEPIQPHRARGNRLGFYLHTTNNDAGLWEAIARVQPPVMLIHEDATNDILLREIRDFRAPNALIVGRFYQTNEAQRAMLESSDPAAAGRSFAERILTHDFGKFTKRSANGRLLIDAWMSLNECLPGPASSSYQEQPATYQRLYTAYDHFQVAFRQRLVQEGIEAVAFNFAAGNFSSAAHYLDFFPGTLDAYTYLGFHEYGWPTLLLNAGTPTGAGLYRGVLAALRSRYGNRHRVIITEAGLTRAYGHPQNPDEGWLNGAEPLDENRYWESLAWYNTLLDQDEVLGACLYQVGHRGDWATFRHLGADNQGRTLHLIDRLAALHENAASRSVSPAALPQPLPRTLHTAPGAVTGKVLLNEKPVAGAVVRLVGDLATLGNVRGAVIDAAGSVTWSRRVTGFTGTLRTAWDRFVAGEIAGLTWAAFKDQALLANPPLRQSGGRFSADQSYFLPENSRATPAYLWDRSVAGYRGTLYLAWLDLVQGKVLGLSYAAFRRQVVAYNPSLAQSGGRLLADQHYLLPRTSGVDRLHLSTTTTPRGRFRLAALPAGDYTLTVESAGAQPFSRAVTITERLDVAVVLDPLLAPTPRAMTRGTGGGAFMGVIGREFVVNNRFFRFIGVNLRGLVWYGSGRTLQYTTPNHRHEVLDRAREMGASVVRVFLPCVNAATQETIDRLGDLLRIAGERGLYILPAFVDFYHSTDFRIPGDDHFYEKLDPNFSGNLLNGAFYRGGYRERYLPFVNAVVAAHRNNPHLFAWEVGNELKYEPAYQDPGRAIFLSFMHTVAREIRRSDPNHLVTTGMISTSHASLDEGDLWRQLYGGPEFDFLTVHCYNEQYSGKQDHDYARALNKPFIVEEAGFGHERPGDRVALTRHDMERWFGFGASGYMQWGFMPVGGDIGDGDDDSGMDRKWHGHDYEGLFNLYRERAALLKAQTDSMAPPVQPTQPTQPPPPTLPALSPGATVYAQTGLRVRHTPGYLAKDASDIITTLNPGQAVTIVGPTETRDELLWWRVRFPLGDGTVVEGWAAQATAEALLLATTAPSALPRGATVTPMG